MKKWLAQYSLIALLVNSWLLLSGAGYPVSYKAQDVVLNGYLAFDETQTGPRPAVLVVHEWWGHNEYARKRANMLAQEGYVALAVDMYGNGQQAAHPDDAKRFSSALFRDFATATNRFQAAVDFLKQQPQVDTSNIAAIGYCFGGGMVLNMARQGLPDLRAVASFHGALDPVVPTHPGQLRAKLLVLHGNDDPLIPAAKVDAFKQEMAAAGGDLTFIGYPQVTHAFTNPEADAMAQQFSLPLAYNAAADQHSWQALRTFLTQVWQKN
ncbi:MAG: dienelactone hydrolase family protein [Magnetococcales bacterium]|nr:dienelactone hydrolase family protein [Magnetococcales bacterium]